MIYGINFNRLAIPPDLARRFAKQLRMVDMRSGKKVWFRLQGVCHTEQEMTDMLITANNGHRQLHVETRHTKEGDVYGIYTY